LAGRLIKKYKAHEGKVNAISVDNNGSIILSCSVNGTVTSCSMKSEGEEKEVILTSQSPLTAICVEDSLSTKKERSFVVGMYLLLEITNNNIGTLSGQLIYHRHTWFTKDIELFRGSSSPVTAIAWRGDVVAWADAGQVRVMNITTQAAVCYLNRSVIFLVHLISLLSSPPNVGPQNPFPCKLFWESEYVLVFLLALGSYLVGSVGWMG
jgi:WD40 repeat protein